MTTSKTFDRLIRLTPTHLPAEQLQANILLFAERPLKTPSLLAVGRIMSRATAELLALFILLLGMHPTAAADTNILEITKDTILDPNRTYGPLVIKSSNVKIDGRGAWVIGVTQGNPASFTGVGIQAQGVTNVVLKNLNAKGWETGLALKNVSEWVIEHCDFSDNFTDPEFGWGENGRRGGIVLTNARHTVIRNCKANRVWDACVIVDSNDNTIENNDFSHTSDTCLKLWNSCRNRITNNNLSYGIRIKPGEVHARDSTSVLIESGSNDNRMTGNDCSHGGDGIFVRVLNGWVSTGNLFENNDCSYANNNCIEAWSPNNTYIRNKASHGSYGFWLGASDKTVLIDNEASYNGLPDGMHNSPHLPGKGHAGIVFMFGPSSHTIARGNKCVGNNGAGIALIGDIETQGAKWKAQHWIIEQNTLASNRWGLYIQYSDWINLGANVFKSNQDGNVQNAGGVTNLIVAPDVSGITLAPKAILVGPSMAKVGRNVELDASKSTDPSAHQLRFRWDLGDGTILTQPRITHAFKQPGFYRVGLTVNNGLLSDLAWRDFYVVENIDELGTEAEASQWDWIDPQSTVKFSDDRQTKISGRTALFAMVQPYGGERVSLLFPKSRRAGLSLAGKKHLVFWLKTINENVPSWQGPNPVVTLHESETRFARLTAKTDLLSQPPYNEAREGWTYIVVPLAGDNQWQREGTELQTLNYLTLGFDSWGAPPLRIWLDGLALK